MAIHKTAGARLYIGPVANPDTIEAMTDEDALSYFDGISGGDWTEVEEIESFGDLGDNSEVATFASVKDRRVRKVKTTRDAGTMAIVCGRDALDAGQIALIAAEKTDNNYAFKIVYADARDEDHTTSTEYFAGMVMSRPTNLGGVQDITKRTFNIGVNTAVYEVPSDSTVAPSNTTRPSIIGSSLAQGSVLTADEGVWDGNPTSFTYQWQADTSGNGTFVNISGATNRTHTIAAGQAGDAIRVQVAGVNAAGTSAAVNSLPVGLAGS